MQLFNANVLSLYCIHTIQVKKCLKITAFCLRFIQCPSLFETGVVFEEAEWRRLVLIRKQMKFDLIGGKSSEATAETEQAPLTTGEEIKTAPEKTP